MENSNLTQKTSKLGHLSWLWNLKCIDLITTTLHLNWLSASIWSTFISADTRDRKGLIHTSMLQQISHHRDNSVALSMCTRSPPSQAGQQPHLLSGWLSERCYFSAALNAPLNHYAGSKTGKAEGLIAVFTQRQVSSLMRSSIDFHTAEGTANDVKS